MKNKGAVNSIVIGAVALGGLGWAFLKNASPYVDIAQARTSGGDDLHVAGSIQKDTLVTDLAKNETRFTIKDDTGTLPIVYTGTPVSNLGDATKVVAVGGMKDGQLVSTQLLVKCPSKYEADKTPK